MAEQMDESGDALLALLELKRLLSAVLLIVEQKWLDELDQLVDGAS